MKEEQRTQIMESSPNGRKHSIETIYDTSLRFIPHSLLAPEGQKNCLSPNRTSLSLPSTKILLSSVASHAHPSKNEHRVLQKFTTTTQHKTQSISISLSKATNMTETKKKAAPKKAAAKVRYVGLIRSRWTRNLPVVTCMIFRRRPCDGYPRVVNLFLTSHYSSTP